MNRLYSILVLITLTLVQLACQVLPVESKDARRIEKVLSDESQFVVNDKDHLNSFLDKYYESLKNSFPKLVKSRSWYVENFDMRLDQSKKYRSSVVSAATQFNEEFDRVFHGKMFSFHYNRNDKSRSFFYMQEPVTDLSYYLQLYLKMNKELEDQNFVVINTMQTIHSDNSYTAEEINELLIEDVEDFLVHSQLAQTKKTFHPICFAYSLSYKLFEDRHDLYDRVIYYTPYPKIGEDAKLLNLKKVFSKNKPEFIDTATISYLYYIARGKAFRSWNTPRAWNKVNFSTFLSLNDVSYQGRSFAKVNNKSLIFTEHEIVLSKSSFLIDEFEKNNIREIKNRYHNDFLWIGMDDYIQSVKFLLN